jgi:hypothetical protein
MFLKSELDLVNDEPDDVTDQDTLYEFYTPSQMEKEFWAKLNYEPDYWFEDNIVFKLPGFDEEIPV